MPLPEFTTTTNEKVTGFRRIAFQIPEIGFSIPGRSFEDAFILANATLFNLQGASDEDKALAAYDKASEIEKTNFALEYALDKTSWNVPHYIKEGLKWLSEKPVEQVAATTIMNADLNKCD